MSRLFLHYDIYPIIRKLINEYGISLTQKTIIHSDQGFHYTSYRFTKILHNKELRQSMSRKGNCWDNAPMESFFGKMKDHIEDKINACTEFNEVKAIVDDYIDYYNNDRYQWDLAKLSPNEFYQFYITGEYPIKTPNPPEVPVPEKKPEELGHKKMERERSQMTARWARSVRAALDAVTRSNL